MKNLLIALLFILSTILAINSIKDTKEYEILLQKHKATVIYVRTLESQMKRVIQDNVLNRKAIPLDNGNVVKITTSHEI